MPSIIHKFFLMLTRAEKRALAHSVTGGTIMAAGLISILQFMPARLGPSQTDFLGDEFEGINISWKWIVAQVSPPGTALLSVLRFVLVWDSDPTQFDDLFADTSAPAQSFFVDDTIPRYTVLRDISIPLNAYTNTIDFTTQWQTEWFGDLNFDVGGRVSKAETRPPPLTSLAHHGVYKLFTCHSPTNVDLTVEIRSRFKFLIKPNF